MNILSGRPRLRHHAMLAALTAVSLGAAMLVGPAAAAGDRLSIVTAYLCLGLLGIVLLLGPLNVLRHGRPLGNSHLRRDIAFWGAATGLAHFFLANVLSMTYEYLALHVENAAAPPSAAVRSDLYQWGVIMGYGVALLFVLLLALSSDRMVRRIGMPWWKRLQRASYLAFGLTCAHAFIFQLLESRAGRWVAVVAVISVVVLVLQGAGIAAIRRGRRSAASGAIANPPS